MNNLNEMNSNTFPKNYSIRFPRKDIENYIPSVAVDNDIRLNIILSKNIKKWNKDTLLNEMKKKTRKKNNANKETRWLRSSSD